MQTLDDVLPDYDARKRYRRWVAGAPKDAVAAALGIPLAPDELVRALFRVRGIPRGGSVYGTLRALGFEQLVCADDRVVLGAARARIAPLLVVGPFSALIRRRRFAAAGRALR